MASRLGDVIIRDTRANQPLATTVAAGTIFCVTDEGNIIERSNGTVWQTYSPSSTGDSKKRTIICVLDGGGAVITTGIKAYIRTPVALTITKVTLLAKEVGSLVVDIWKDSYANYPPTVADTITAAAKPTLAAANKSEDSTLTGWTKTAVAGDVYGFNVDSAATVTWAILILDITVT